MGHARRGVVVAVLGLLGCAYPSKEFEPAGVGTCGDAEACPFGKQCVSGACVDVDAGVFDTGPIGDAPTDAPCAIQTFPMTETQVTFAVPAGVKFMHVKAWGAGGNGEGQCTPKPDGGVGGYSEAVFEVKPGDPLIVIVGKRGRSGVTGEDRARFGFGEWGGGGLSGVFTASALITDTDRDKALIIAGGGGSAGAPGCNPGGTGNSSTAGGMPTMKGGVGADGVNGGAGGYAGGSGGAKGLASKGGTGFVAASALDKKMLSVAASSTTAPNSTDPDYADNAGLEEMSGRVVIRFLCDRPVIK